MVLTNRTCPSENTLATEQSSFFDGRWDAHEIGWVIAGVTALASTIISLTSLLLHARNYYVPKEQRQMLRIILMPPVYSIISFFSYRYFRSYTYYSVALVAYEALVLAAFLMLLLQYIGESTDEQRRVLLAKEKSKIPIPFCCIRYRPSKPYFLHALKWSVLQYSFLRPIISVIGIVTEAVGLLCPTQYSIYYAEVYLDSVDFVSISVALYGLIVFYALVKDRLQGKKPLLKFLAIKGIVMITFYQGFVFGVLEDYHVIKATPYWTAENVGNGLQALCTCCEMVIFAIVFLFAFSHKPYQAVRPAGASHTNPFWAILDSLNYSDFFIEGWRGIVFAFNFIRGRPGTHASTGPLDIDQAFLKDKSGGLHAAESNTSSEVPMRETYAQQQVPTSSLPSNAFGGGPREEERGRYARGNGRPMQGSVENYEMRTTYDDERERRQYDAQGYSDQNDRW